MTTPQTSKPSPADSFELAVIAHSAASLSTQELAALRQSSIERFSGPLRPQLLKHSDDQTLAAASALARAIEQLEARGYRNGFADWAIVSCTRYLGRSVFAAVIKKYQIEGPWGVSVQAIPHNSPHALASTLSLALGSHGPCIGSGAAPGEEPQALLSTATLLERTEIAGAWIVFSGWPLPNPPHAEGGVSPQTGSIATVFAVVNSRLCDSDSDHIVGRVRIHPTARSVAAAAMDNTVSASLSDWFLGHEGDQPDVHCLSTQGATITVELFGEARRQLRRHPGAAVPLAGPHASLRPAGVAPAHTARSELR